MKTSFITFALFLPAFLVANQTLAQSPVLGVTAGASINSVKLEGLQDVSTDFSSVSGAEGGFYISFNAPGFYVRPMALASFLRGQVETQEAESVKQTSDFELTTLEVPVIVGLKLLPAISIEGGPSWNYAMSYTHSINNVAVDLNRHTLGYRAGVRVAIGRFGVFGHYGGIIDNSTTNNNAHLDRPSRLIFGATFDLAGGH